jgi:hypothetical protein
MRMIAHAHLASFFFIYNLNIFPFSFSTQNAFSPSIFMFS